MATANLITRSIGDICIQHGNGIPNHTAPKGSLYIDKNTGKHYENTDGAATWAENERGGGGGVMSNLNVGDKSGAGITTQSATYIVMGYLSAHNATIASSKVVVRQNGGGTGQVRIWNVTQGNVVMESAAFSNIDVIHTVDMGTVTNQPATNDVIEIELKRVSGSGGNDTEFFSVAILYT